MKGGDSLIIEPIHTDSRESEHVDLAGFMEGVKRRNPGQTEFIQAVQEVAEDIFEFIEGKELKDYLDGNERFDLKRIYAVMTQLLDALHFAHEAKIIHRDVKPANVMMTKAGQAKLADFGVARFTEPDGEQMEATRAGTIVGTPSYMAPEQIQGQPLDGRCDIFSAGIIFYQLLTWQKPFTGSQWELAKKIIEDDPVWPSKLMDIPPDLDKVVARALAKSAERRYATAGQFAEAVVVYEKYLSDPNHDPSRDGEVRTAMESARAKLDGKTYTADDIAQSKADMARGLEAVRNGRYDEALEAFRSAHAHNPLPEFLHNQAYCLEKLNAPLAAAMLGSSQCCLASWPNFLGSALASAAICCAFWAVGTIIIRARTLGPYSDSNARCNSSCVTCTSLAASFLSASIGQTTSRRYCCSL